MEVTRIVDDGFSAVEIVHWDFRSMNIETFESRFKASIKKPLKRLLRDFERNPTVQMPSSLQKSLLGLINGLADYYSFLLSHSDQQIRLNLLQVFGSTPRKVGLIIFESAPDIRRSCLSILDRDKAAPFVFRPRSLQEMESFLSGPAFADQRRTLRLGAQPGYSFPLLLCWKLAELVPTSFPDTFVEPKIIRLLTAAELKDSPPPSLPISSSGSFAHSKQEFLNALGDDADLYMYVAQTCALCRNSGATFKLKWCTGCDVARYCGDQHQRKHWKVHKKHCGRLRALREAHTHVETQSSAQRHRNTQSLRFIALIVAAVMVALLLLFLLRVTQSPNGDAEL